MRSQKRWIRYTKTALWTVGCICAVLASLWFFLEALFSGWTDQNGSSYLLLSILCLLIPWVIAGWLDRREAD